MLKETSNKYSTRIYLAVVNISKSVCGFQSTTAHSKKDVESFTSSPLHYVILEILNGGIVGASLQKFSKSEIYGVLIIQFVIF